MDYITAFAVEIPVAKDDDVPYNQVTDQVSDQVSVQVKELILCLFGNRLDKNELLNMGKLSNLDKKARKTLERNYITPAIEADYVTMLYPNNPHHPKQKYYLTEKGKQLYMQIQNKQ